MKIIAHSKIGSYGRGPEKVIIEATADEVARLFGKPSAYDNETLVKIGTEINVDAAYQYIGWIYRHRDRFERIANELREAAASVDKFPELYADLSIPEKPE